MRTPFWSLALQIAFVVQRIDAVAAISVNSERRINVPATHVALSGNLEVELLGFSSSDAEDYHLELLWITDQSTQLLATIPLHLNDSDGTAININSQYSTKKNSTIVVVPCGYFLQGGVYNIKITSQQENNISDFGEVDDIQLNGQLDVRWPFPKLTFTPEIIQTYPESTVSAFLEFPEVMCAPIINWYPSAIPEFWLELLFCGPDTYCVTQAGSNETEASARRSPVLYSEQVRGLPAKRELTLRCELFGLAGHYVLNLRPSNPVPSIPAMSAYIKADWSDQFVFNVHARSIFPCDGHSDGVGVLFQYPTCILDQADRVRVFAKLRADVSSLAPPTSLHYLTEKKVIKGQHSLFFDCELFSERFVEYCFVYVSQSISGAVADVRMDCVPTLPVQEAYSGGWGIWSAWTSCSTTCTGGTRNRYRLCNSPPPRYGSQFCKGSAVETKTCGEASSGDWQCIYGGMNDMIGEVPADRPEVLAEIGPGCRCGCVVHLSSSKPRRLVATSSQSCPGRTFWLIEAEGGYMVRFKVDFFRLPCGSQWFNIRDGDSLSTDLIGHMEGPALVGSSPDLFTSSGKYLLLEFFSDELVAATDDCAGGFLAHARQITSQSMNSTIPPPAKTLPSLPAAAVHLTIAHIVAILFVSIILVLSAMLGAQYIFRYRKYHLAEDLDSLDTPSMCSMTLQTRAVSNATLLSEVISLTKFRPKFKTKHSRLRQSLDCENLEVSQEKKVELSEDSSREETDPSVNDLSKKPNEETINCESQQESGENSTNITSPSKCSQTSSVSSRNEYNEKRLTANNVINNSSHSVSDRDVDTSNMQERDRRARTFSNGSNVVLTNGYYSPATSIISTATIRTTIPKESKEKRNRERLLQNPGSDMSLANTDLEMEFDYYDYNVVNAGAAPGSYLGMDPAFLVWIPPLGDEEHHYEEILPNSYSVDPGSNNETPDEEMLPTCEDLNTLTYLIKNESVEKLQNSLMIDTNILENNPIPLIEFSKSNNTLVNAKVHSNKNIYKTTKLLKSPRDVNDFNKLDDIQFADDDDECEIVN